MPVAQRKTARRNMAAAAEGALTAAAVEILRNAAKENLAIVKESRFARAKMERQRENSAHAPREIFEGATAGVPSRANAEALASAMTEDSEDARADPSSRAENEPDLADLRATASARDSLSAGTSRGSIGQELTGRDLAGEAPKHGSIMNEACATAQNLAVQASHSAGAEDLAAQRSHSAPAADEILIAARAGCLKRGASGRDSIAVSGSRFAPAVSGRDSNALKSQSTANAGRKFLHRKTARTKRSGAALPSEAEAGAARASGRARSSARGHDRSADRAREAAAAFAERAKAARSAAFRGRTGGAAVGIADREPGDSRVAKPAESAGILCASQRLRL
jgi:hypothetical protein